MASSEVAVIARRRRFSLEQKQQILAEADRTSMAAVSRRHGIARSLLQKWKMLGIPDAIAMTSPKDAFVRLLPSSQVPGNNAATGGSVFIHVDAALVIELPAAAEPLQIAALVAALRE